MPLHTRHNAPLVHRLLAHVVLELLALLLNIDRIERLLLQLDLPLIFNMNHLVLEVVLHFKILSKLDDMITLGLYLMLSGIFINDTSPESILLFLSNGA